jgi:hypothetical protein
MKIRPLVFFRSFGAFSDDQHSGMHAARVHQEALTPLNQFGTLLDNTSVSFYSADRWKRHFFGQTGKEKMTA